MFFFLLYILINFFCLLPAAQNNELCFTVDLTSDQINTAEIQKAIKDSTIIESVEYYSDIYLDQDEFYYLLGFKAGESINAAHCIESFQNFAKKGKFCSVRITVRSGQAGGIILTYSFEGLWTFTKVRFKGVLLGKDAYQQYYILEPGERFDINKHRDSLEQILAGFKSEGYFNGKVADFLSYDLKTKSVAVSISLDPGSRFVIKEISLDLNCSVEHDGNEISSLKKKIIQHIKSSLKKSYYSDQLLQKEKDYIKKYLSKKGYLNASVKLRSDIDTQQNAVKVTCTIQLYKKRKFVFFGNHFFTRQDLVDQLLVFGKLADSLPLSVLTEEIAQAYYLKGFWNSHIDPQQEPGQCFFVIDEGLRACILSVEIAGSSYQEWPHLVKSIFYPVIKRGYYDDEKLKKALADLSDAFHAQGFWQFNILKHEFVPLEKPGQYTLLITVEDGVRCFFKHIRIKEYPELENKGPFEQINTSRERVPFDIRLLQEQKDWLVGYFKERGYLYADVYPQVSCEGSEITIQWDIQNIDKQVSFGKTIVISKGLFPNKYILRELTYKEGDPWDKKKLQESADRLRDLGIFETVYLYPGNIGKFEDSKNVIVKVFEDDPFELRLRLGFQQVGRNLTFRSGTTYKIGSSFVWKNPFNVGDTLRADVDFTRFYRNATFVYTLPWIFGIPVRTQFSGYTNKYIQAVYIGSKKPLYDAIQEGFLIGFNKKNSYVDVGCNIGAEIMETTGLSPILARAINFETALVNKKVPYILLEPTVLVDLLDDQLNPRLGSLTLVSLRGMFPWKEATYFVRILFEQSFFVPIYRNIVFGMRFRCGHIFNQDFPNIMPPERFYLGGENSLRSYLWNEAPPLGSFYDEEGKEVFVPQGGKSMINANAEFRIPIIGSLGMVIFQDLGMLVERGFSDIPGGMLLAATGFGLRYNTPIGPLRFDLGFKWKRRVPGESLVAAFFTLGQAF